MDTTIIISRKEYNDDLKRKKQCKRSGKDKIKLIENGYIYYDKSGWERFRTQIGKPINLKRTKEERERGLTEEERDEYTGRVAYLTGNCWCGFDDFREKIVLDDWNKTLRQIDNEISCIGMIDSLLCYDYGKDTPPKEIIKREKEKYHNYLADDIEELGEEVVEQLIKGQQSLIQEIKYGVGEDSEGVIYNSMRLERVAA